MKKREYYGCLRSSKCYVGEKSVDLVLNRANAMKLIGYLAGHLVSENGETCEIKVDLRENQTNTQGICTTVTAPLKKRR